MPSVSTPHYHIVKALNNPAARVAVSMKASLKSLFAPGDLDLLRACSVIETIFTYMCE